MQQVTPDPQLVGVTSDGQSFASRRFHEMRVAALDAFLGETELKTLANAHGTCG